METFYIQLGDNQRIAATLTEDPEGMELEEQEWVEDGEEVVPGWTNGQWQAIQERK